MLLATYTYKKKLQTMKNKITLVFAFWRLPASRLRKSLSTSSSFEGFVDMSYWHEDNYFDGSDNCYGLDQVEINWLFNFEQVAASSTLPTMVRTPANPL